MFINNTINVDTLKAKWCLTLDNHELFMLWCSLRHAMAYERMMNYDEPFINELKVMYDELSIHVDDTNKED